MNIRTRVILVCFGLVALLAMTVIVINHDRKQFPCPDNPRISCVLEVE